MAKKQKANIHLVKNSNGASYYVFDFYYDNANKHKKRIYGDSVKDVENKTQAFIEAAINDYRYSFPKGLLFEDVVSYFIKGLRLFHNNPFEAFTIGYTDFTEFDIDHYEHLFNNIIKDSRLCTNIEDLSKEDFEKFLMDVAEYHDYETVEAISFLCQYACFATVSAGFKAIDFSTVKKPEKYSGYSISGASNATFFEYFLNRKEYESLLDYCWESHNNLTRNHFKSHTDLITLSLLTGVEFKELLNLPYSCIDLDNKTLRLKSRNVHLSDRSIEMYRRAEFMSGKKISESEKVFGTTANGSLDLIGNINKCLRRIEKHLGIPQVTSKNLSYSYIILELEEGKKENEIIEELGNLTELELRKIKQMYLKFKDQK